MVVYVFTVVKISPTYKRLTRDSVPIQTFTNQKEKCKTNNAYDNIEFGAVSATVFKIR